MEIGPREAAPEERRSGSCSEIEGMQALRQRHASQALVARENSYRVTDGHLRLVAPSSFQDQSVHIGPEGNAEV